MSLKDKAKEYYEKNENQWCSKWKAGKQQFQSFCSVNEEIISKVYEDCAREIAKSILEESIKKDWDCSDNEYHSREVIDIKDLEEIINNIIK